MSLIFYILIFIFSPIPAFADTGHIIISEIQTYGQTAADEFVRLYNPTSAAIDISGWKLTKKTSSGTESNLVSSFADGTTISANSYFLIAHKTGYQGDETADATYSGASYSIANNNTAILKDSAGAVIDKVGFGTAADYESAPVDNPENDASIKRQNNQDTDNNKNDFSVAQNSAPDSSTENATQETATQNSTASVSYGDIVVNEIFPNPSEGKEWIEFYNTTSADVGLTGWTVSDGSGEIYNLSGAIGAKEFLTIELSNRLNNSGDAVYLTDASRTLMHSLIYGSWSGASWPAPEKDQSLARGDDKKLYITDTPTKNSTNQFTELVTTVPNSVKNYSSSTAAASSAADIANYISIIGIAPNPAGADAENEYIKIFNDSDGDINIGGIYLDDEDGGSKPYRVPNGTLIKAKNYLTFYSAKTKLSLANSGGEARMLDFNKEELQSIEYEDAKEGAVYILKDGKWGWADGIKTQEQKNIKTSDGSSVVLAKAGASSIIAVVIAPPDLFSSQIMYVDGRQLYMYSRDWPDLRIGDKISAYGTPSTYYNEPRLKISNKNNIKIISKNNSASSTLISGGEIDDDAVGKLITVEGEITDVAAQKIYMDSAGAEILIYKKSNRLLSFTQFKIGDAVEATGVLSKYKDDYRLLPRTDDDLTIISSSEKISLASVDKITHFWQYIASTLTIGAFAGVTAFIRRKRNAQHRDSKPPGQLG